MPFDYTWYPLFLWDIEDGDYPEEEEDIGNKCEELYSAMKGWGTDEKSLISVMGTLSTKERYMVATKFEKVYGNSLYDKMKSEVGGDMGRALKLLSLSSVEAEAKMIFDAMKGMGAHEHLLYPILCARSNGDMTLLKKEYYKRYDKDLVSHLKSNLGGDFEKLMVMCAQGIEEGYDPEDVHTEERVEQDVKIFYKSGEGTWGTDESKFFKIICASPAEHLKAVDAAYTKKYGNTLKKAAKKELGGDTEDAALYILSVKLGDTNAIIAEEIKKTTKGIGTDEDGLMNWIIRLVVVPELFRAVMEEHEKLFDKTLEKRVSSEVGGDFETLLLKLIKNGKTGTYE